MPRASAAWAARRDIGIAHTLELFDIVDNDRSFFGEREQVILELGRRGGEQFIDFANPGLFCVT